MRFENRSSQHNNNMAQKLFKFCKKLGKAATRPHLLIPFNVKTLLWLHGQKTKKGLLLFDHACHSCSKTMLYVLCVFKRLFDARSEDRVTKQSSSLVQTAQQKKRLDLSPDVVNDTLVKADWVRANQFPFEPDHEHSKCSMNTAAWCLA
jgi:hypothetical protein